MDMGGSGRGDILRTLEGCAETSDGPDDDCADILTLSNQCSTFADQIHASVGGVLVEGWVAPAVYDALLLYDETDRGSKNELLAAQLFAIIFRNRYLAHFGDTVYEYENGSWNLISTLSYGALDYISPALRTSDVIPPTMRAEAFRRAHFQLFRRKSNPPSVLIPR